MIVGYTTGVFDLFHIGHLNLLKNARAMCDRLIVGITVDEIMKEYKNKTPVIPFAERCEIVRSIKYVDVVVPQKSFDKFEAWEKYRFDMMFVGDDWYNTPKWEEYKKQFDEVNVRIIYFPYTAGTSSTLINQILLETRAKL
jgi:glycerol-3-phosphate cytidylyltransferase